MNHEEALRRIAELEAENERLTEALRKAHITIANAKDIDPIQRLSEKRVAKMAASACLKLVRHKVKGWVISIGNACQWYRSLWDIWAILSQESWSLSELIPSTITPKHLMIEQAAKIVLLKETGLSEIDSSVKEESVCPKVRNFNRLKLPPVTRKPERHPPKRDRYKPTDAVPQTRHQNRSLLPQIQWEWDKSLVPFS